VAGKTIGTLSRKRTAARVKLRGSKPVTVRIVMRLKSGRTVTDTRRYRPCLKA
jgi:hypothetical protein